MSDKSIKQLTDEMGAMLGSKPIKWPEPISAGIAKLNMDWCHCGNPKHKQSLFCEGCLMERHAERIKDRNELMREIYPEDM